MLKSLLAGVLSLALFVSPAPADTTQAPLISDTVKFVREDPKVINAVHSLNLFVNHAMVYQTDSEHYGEEEKWVTMPSDGKGDCEDFALAKMELLRRSGVPVVAVARIRGVVVKDGKGEILGAHAILELLLPNGSVAILDNRFDELMTRRELERKGYVFFDWGQE